MDDSPRLGSRSRDECYLSYDLSNAIYGALPTDSMDFSPRRSSASPSHKKASKRQRSGDSTPPRGISLPSSACWLPLSKKRNLAQQDHQRMDLHQSTCLNLNMASQESSESDLWILPDFDDWAYDTANFQNPTSRSTQSTIEWAPFLRRAANSNLERLRARLEGDGWAFVGGKYEEEKKVLQEEASLSEESVDEEFDVVILPALRVS